MRQHFYRFLIPALAFMGWIMLSPAWAQSNPLQLGRDASIYKTDQVQAQLQAYAPQGLASGQSMWLGVALHHAKGWHTYWKNPGDTGLPTHLNWKLPPGFSVGEVIWPLPEKIQVGELTNLGFENDTLLLAPLKLQDVSLKLADTLTFSVHASWLVCQNECIPQEGDLSLTLSTHASLGQHRTAFEGVIAQQPLQAPNLQAKARALPTANKAGLLDISILGLPTTAIGRQFEVLAQESELIDARGEQAKGASLTWNNGVLQANLPVHEMRSSEPKNWTLLLIESPRPKSQPPVSYSVPVSMSGAWPELPELVPSASLGGDTLTSPASAGSSPLSATPSSVTQTQTTPSLFLGALLAALLGGLILNLMPCVLPVLALKAMAYTRAGDNPKAHLNASILFTAGVVLSMLALGGLVFGLRAAGQQVGWGFQLQSPWVIASLAALFTLIALNLWGLFEVGTQVQSLAGNFQSRHAWFDSFGSGVLAVAVASPCTAPFMGASVGLAFGLPTWQGMSIFASLGLGLSLPILLLGLVPQTARFIPKPGPWMETLRRALGFPMLGTVVWLLWVLGHLSGIDASSTLLTLLLLLGFGIWLHSSPVHSPSPQARQGIRKGTGLLIILASVVLAGAWLMGLENEGGDTVSGHTSATSDASSPSQPSGQMPAWTPWSEARVQQTLQQGHPVFIDYTAKWCITCQVNKASTLKNTRVLESFKSHQVQLFEADWTRQDPAITASLKALGRSGVPVYVLMSPQHEVRVLSEVLTPALLLKELDSL